MFVEPDGFIIVTVEEALAVKPGFVDQTWQMHIAAKFLVRTAGMQSLHGEILLLGRGQRPRVDPRKIALWNGCDDRFLFLQQFSLCKVRSPNHKLTGKHAAFFHRNCPRRDVSFERAFFLNLHGLGNDLSRHPSLDFDAFRSESSKAMNIGFTLDDDAPRANPPRNFPCEVDRRGIVARDITSESAANCCGPTM